MREIKFRFKNERRFPYSKGTFRLIITKIVNWQILSTRIATNKAPIQFTRITIVKTLVVFETELHSVHQSHDIERKSFF